MSTDDLKKLVEAAQAGDDVAFAQLFDLYYDRLFAYALRRTLDVGTAEDIAANSMLKVVKNLYKFKWRHEHSFSGYVFKIASNELNQYFRKSNRVSYVENDELDRVGTASKSAHAVAEKKLDEALMQKTLQEHVKTLNPKAQEIVQMYYFDNLCHREISVALNMKEGAVRVALHRALKQLESSLKSNKEFTELATNTIGGEI